MFYNFLSTILWKCMWHVNHVLFPNKCVYALWKKILVYMTNKKLFSIENFFTHEVESIFLLSQWFSVGKYNQTISLIQFRMFKIISKCI